MKNESQIVCPNCGAPVNVNEVLTKQLEENLKKKYNQQLAEEKQKFQKELDQITEQREQLELDKKTMNEQVQLAVSQKLKTEKLEMEKQLRKSIADEEQEKLTALQNELNEKSEKLKEFNRAVAEIEKLKREKDEMKETIEAEQQKILNEKLNEARESIKKNEQTRYELSIKELQKKLDDQKKLTEEMQRKQEQGSMQLQGEAQELAIEEWLRTTFPLDTIEEIKKGTSGADCVQVVNTHQHPNCGKIYYESKRTKAFGGDWIEKFKADMRTKGVAVGILVTQTMPKDMERMGLKDGVWVCTFEEFKSLSLVIRESVIKISEIAASQENKGDKMTMLYDYLTSQEFKSHIEAIVEGFMQMKSDLDSEKRAMLKIWNTREKQLEKVIANTTGMYGSIKGIAGAAIGTVKSLELGAGIDSPDEEV
jgi:hypothetical protein